MAGMKVKYGLALSEARYKRFIRPITPGSKRPMVTKVVGSTSDRSRTPGMSIVGRESEQLWVLDRGSPLLEGKVLPPGMRGRPSDKWRRSNPKGSQRFSGKGSIETVKSITR
jgi:hypothetical protein